ncbi:MAG: FimV/HubP family polar landmark protein, partial [Mariprofundaceae bacterium]
MPLSSHAVGFGTANLKSHLGEDFKVQVPLLLSENEQVGDFIIELASPDEYRKMGLNSPKGLALLRVSVETSSLHGNQVFITSVEAIQEPLVTVLLKARKGRGQYFKYMQFFLDPIQNIAPPKAQYAKHKIMPVKQVTEEKIDDEKDDSKVWNRVSNYGPVRAGDSLSVIAFRIRKDRRWHSKQIMMALYKNNPDAFIDGNINQLRQGAWLQVPNDEYISQFKAKESIQQINSMLQTKPVKPVAMKKARLTKLPSKSKATLKPEVKIETTPDSPVFKGQISMAGGRDAQNLKQDDVADMLKKTSAMHEKMMADGLRMDTLSERLLNLESNIELLH